VQTKLIINARAEQAVIALLQDDKLTELILEKSDNRFSVGDIYLGKVKKIATGLNAAFVDVGYDKDAFLHYHDLGPQIRSWQTFLKRTQKGKQGWSLTNFRIEPHINKDGKIDEVLKSGQDILVQIAKEPISTKGPRITSEISLPGRFLVLVPFSDRVSISQKIRKREERDRLRKLAKEIRPKGFGIIIRTVAEGISVEDLDSDIKALLKKFRQIHRKAGRAKAPARVSQEMNRASAFLRDVFNESFERIVVDDNELANEIREYVDSIHPEKSKIVHNFRGKTPIFQYFGVDRQIKTGFGRSVSMAKGAYLIIEHTEAMHVIDVNSGNRTNRAEGQEANALATNLLAAEEIARQLRLRDMGGIIVIDFIDMHRNENKRALYDKLREVMKSDRAKHKILPPSKFGVVEITRQRVRPEMNIPTREENPDTLVEAPIALIDEMESEFESLAFERKYKAISLHAHPFIQSYLTKGNGWVFTTLRRKWQSKYRQKLKVVPRDAYTMLEYHFFDENEKEITPKRK
jgi:ribonuclease G